MTISLLLLTAVAVSGARANTYLVTTGGHGADPVPIRTNKIRMVSEDLESKLKGDAWWVDGRFVFSNVLKRPVEVEIGFPFPAATIEQVGVLTPAGHRHRELDEPLVSAFAVISADNKTQQILDRLWWYVPDPG